MLTFANNYNHKNKLFALSKEINESSSPLDRTVAQLLGTSRTILFVDEPPVAAGFASHKSDLK